jgi:ParB-like chromosome segregation protein Spo0J
MTTKKYALNAGIIGRRIEQIPIDQLRPYASNPRTHSEQQLNLISQSIARFGFINPVLIDHDNVVIAGHGRIMAALKLGLSTVPALRIEHLDAAAKRAYGIFDNRLAELGGWDLDILATEQQELIDIYKNT